MCGIIGIISARSDVVPDIVQGLRQLEYRGYDSAGVAIVKQGVIERTRAEGKLRNLDLALQKTQLESAIAIGHTRWATHGVPSERNAHPHATDKVAVVHNGIIENYQLLKAQLLETGYQFQSDTDSEVIPALITRYLLQGLSEAHAVQETVKQLQGAFAIAIIFADKPDTVFAVRHGAPLAVGYKDDYMVIGSDAIAFSHITSTLSYMEDGDIAIVTKDDVRFVDVDGNKQVRKKHTVNAATVHLGKGEYRHFMQKEIHEQPVVIAETLSVYYNPAKARIQLPPLPFDLGKISRINLVACGTAFYAGLVARYWFEQIARISTEIDIASEFRYREPILDADGLTIVISQSGETADTLAALRYAKQYQHTLAVINVAESTIAREAEAVLYTHAGPEIGVASTKAFTTQLTVLAALTIALTEAKGQVETQQLQTLTGSLLETSSKMAQCMQVEESIQTIAENIASAKDILYLGRGTSYAIAYEGALKLKEISYIHAEAYAAGEMKHGPIALIDEHMPVIAIVPSDHLFEKTVSNLQEAAARGAKIIAFTDQKGKAALEGFTVSSVILPEAAVFSSPILYAIPCQMLAYHVALLKGTDVDQPRNLAKSVTVE